MAQNGALSWTVALHHFLHLEHEPLEKLCMEVGFNICRRFQICALSSVPGEVFWMVYAIYQGYCTEWWDYPCQWLIWRHFNIVARSLMVKKNNPLLLCTI